MIFTDQTKLIRTPNFSHKKLVTTMRMRNLDEFCELGNKHSSKDKIAHQQQNVCQKELKTSKLPCWDKSLSLKDKTKWELKDRKRKGI